MQKFEQCGRPKKKNNNNKAKLRPALYVRTNAGKKISSLNGMSSFGDLGRFFETA
jgi:hypothetical protein